MPCNKLISFFLRPPAQDMYNYSAPAPLAAAYCFRTVIYISPWRCSNSAGEEWPQCTVILKDWWCGNNWFKSRCKHQQLVGSVGGCGCRNQWDSPTCSHTHRCEPSHSHSECLKGEIIPHLRCDCYLHIDCVYIPQPWIHWTNAAAHLEMSIYAVHMYTFTQMLTCVQHKIQSKLDFGHKWCSVNGPIAYKTAQFRSIYITDLNTAYSVPLCA